MLHLKKCIVWKAIQKSMLLECVFTVSCIMHCQSMMVALEISGNLRASPFSTDLSNDTFFQPDPSRWTLPLIEKRAQQGGMCSNNFNLECIFGQKGPSDLVAQHNPFSSDMFPHAKDKFPVSQILTSINCD
jgi:hypothetical protein